MSVAARDRASYVFPCGELTTTVCKLTTVVVNCKRAAPGWWRQSTSTGEGTARTDERRRCGDRPVNPLRRLRHAGHWTLPGFHDRIRLMGRCAAGHADLTDARRWLVPIDYAGEYRHRGG